ncbi:MAG: 16S rRNA (cytidine(1402)-2'-O)-methyltransferase [Spirochaetes bacterium]|nr:16S rRNA (cytidine(1402)-2'-O)-methyltransferase [Spirochaetota bacterium]
MGSLYIVSTPIGNLKDITFRAIEILNNVDIILCEDTRISLKLLNHYSINKKLISLHSYNENKLSDKIINILIKEKKNIALITDNGTPTISDPGNILIGKCYENGIEVVPVPGASAFSCALSICGFSTDSFCFLGFLPKKEGKKKKILLQYINFNGLIVIYESPFRVMETLRNIEDVFGNEVFVFIGRELTKKFEQKIRGKLKDIKSMISEENMKGEFVIIINNYNKKNG